MILATEGYTPKVSDQVERGLIRENNQEAKGNSEVTREIHTSDARSCSQDNHKSDIPQSYTSGEEGKKTGLHKAC